MATILQVCHSFMSSHDPKFLHDTNQMISGDAFRLCMQILFEGLRSSTSAKEKVLTAARVASDHGSALALSLGGFVSRRRVFRRDPPGEESSLDGGVLNGIPVAIKANICVEGMPTTAASRMLAGTLQVEGGTLHACGIFLVDDLIKHHAIERLVYPHPSG